MRPTLATLLLLLLLCAPALQASERILSYDSDIVVHADGSQAVTEIIQVRAEGVDIKRGIYRDFPTDYHAPDGRRVRVAFNVSRVERDGRPEPFHTERLSNGVRVYVGRSDVFLKPGTYTYRLSYVTDRQLGFFKEHDELYWNVTGNGWKFAIDTVTARVQLPPGVPVGRITAEAYTGLQGERGRDYESKLSEAGATFATTRELNPQEGLTLVVGWPKGVVHEPSFEDRVRWEWNDNRALFIVWIGATVLFAYYLFAWWAVGRDPATGVIVPQYEPPAGYPPAALRLIRRMGWDDKTLSAALVGLAVKGALTISEDDDKYELKPTAPGQPGKFSPDEERILVALGGHPMKFEPSNHAAVSGLRRVHRTALQEGYEKSHFYSNRGWMVPGWILTVAVVGYAALQLLESGETEGFFVMFVSVFVGMFGMPFFTALWRLREVSARTAANGVKLAVSFAMFGFLLWFLVPDLLRGLDDSVPWALFTGLALIGGLDVVFNFLMKAPTQAGRKLLDQAEGFRQYLGIAESDELKFKYARPVTPEIFEAYLPYAIALDVETQWAERFAASLRAGGREPSEFRTAWYSGSSFSGVSGLTQSCSSSLPAIVSSSSNAPGSSSGSSGGGGGGGGSSGGGGGGGGGGGW